MAKASKIRWSKRIREILENSKFDHPILGNQLKPIVENTYKELSLAADLSTSVATIKKQLEMNGLSIKHSFENTDLRFTQQKMSRQLFETDGKFIGCFNESTKNELLFIASGKIHFWEIFSVEPIKNIVSDYSSIAQKVASHPYNISLYNCIHYIEQKNIPHARKFLEEVAPSHSFDRCSQCKIYTVVKNEYETLYSSVYNTHNIEHALCNKDPLWLEIYKPQLDSRPENYAELRNSVEALLKFRETISEPIFKKVQSSSGMSRNELPPFVVRTCYEIAHNSLDRNAIKAQLSILHCNSADTALKQAYPYFIKDGLETVLSYPNKELFKDILISEQITSSSNSHLRSLYQSLMELPLENPTEVAWARKATLYLNEACNNMPYKEVYTMLSTSIHNSLAVGDTSNILLTSTNFAQNFSHTELQYCKKHLMPVLAETLNFLEKTHNQENCMQNDQLMQCAQAKLTHINNAFLALEENNSDRALFFINTVIPHCVPKGYQTINKLITEYDQKCLDLKSEHPNLARLLTHTKKYGPDLAKATALTTGTAAIVSTIQSFQNTSNRPLSTSVFESCMPDLEIKNLPQICALPEEKIPLMNGTSVPQYKPAALIPNCGTGEIQKIFDRKLEELLKSIEENNKKEDKSIDNQCNWSKQKKLPSLAQEDVVKLPENPLPDETNLDEKYIPAKIITDTDSIVETIKEKLVEGRTINAEQEEKLNFFIVNLHKLIHEYNLEIVVEALKYYNLTFNNACKSTSINVVKNISDLIKELNEWGDWRALARDAAHGGAITAGSIQEAKGAIDCMKNKILKTLVRSKNIEEDFIEIETQKKWDIKTPMSYSLHGKRVFNIQEILSSIKDEYETSTEDIIIQLSFLEFEDKETFLSELKKVINNTELARTVIIDCHEPYRNRQPNELLKEWIKNVD